MAGGGDVLLLVDEDGRVAEWRPKADELFGLPADRAVGQPVADLVRAPGSALGQSELLVRPLLCGDSVMWEVRAGGDSLGARDMALLKVMFSQAPVGLHVLDDQLRLVRMNSATRALHDAALSPGRHFGEVFQLDDPVTEEEVARRVLETGEPVVNRLVRGALGEGRPHRRMYLTSVFRLEGPHGEVLGLVAAASDVTERQTSRRRMAVLDAVRERVGQRLDVVAVCEELAETVVPAFAGIVVVEVVEDVVRGEVPPLVPVDRDVPLRRAAYRGKISAYPVGDVRHLPYGTPFARVLADLQPRLIPVDEDSMWLAADPARADAIRRQNVHSLIVAPLAVRGEALGLVSFYRHEDEDLFDEDDVRLALDVCTHAALCIENARRFTRERTIAATVQRRLLPQRPAPRIALETSHLHLPGMEGGGAWFDVIPLPGARTALVAGDVKGRGVEAATTMGQLRTVIHSLAALDLQPEELLARLSDTATRLAAERAALPAGDPLHREPLTAECVIAVYDPLDLTCTIALAGHPQPIAVFPDGAIESLPVSAGPLLAETSNTPFSATTVALPEHTTLLFGTSPLTDLLHPGSGTLHGLLERYGRGPLQELSDAFAYAIRNGSQPGDLLMLFARTRGFPGDRVLTCPLPSDAEAAPIARSLARRRLAQWGVDEETAFTTELIVSELVGNAVRYGAPPLQLRLVLDATLTCEVSDAGASAPHLKHARTLDESGRGLFIISRCADQWGTRYHAEGKTIWAEQSLQTPVPPLRAADDDAGP
ncbi:SpoIIE family protein phosphatase [Streptomyces sp. NBC_00510]